MNILETSVFISPTDHVLSFSRRWAIGIKIVDNFGGIFKTKNLRSDLDRDPKRSSAIN